MVPTKIPGDSQIVIVCPEGVLGPAETFTTVDSAVKLVNRSKDVVELMQFYLVHSVNERGPELVPYFNETTGDCESFVLMEEMLTWIMSAG